MSNIKDRIDSRVKQAAIYFTENQTTVRVTAKNLGVCKSTIYRDLVKHLKYIDLRLYFKSKERLFINKQERHIRGGNATRQKYINLYSPQIKKIILKELKKRKGEGFIYISYIAKKVNLGIVSTCKYILLLTQDENCPFEILNQDSECKIKYFRLK